MADEEAERESGGPGGDLLELRRLRERLLELETGLRESREPAVQAATEYCKQLCQLQGREASEVRMTLQSVKAAGVFCLKGKEKNSKDWNCSLSVEKRSCNGKKIE